MPELTRRRALLAVASGVAAVAGCTGGDGDRPMIDYRRNEQSIQDYDVQQVRHEDGAVLFTQRDELPNPDDDERGRDRNVRSGRSVVVSEAKLAELTFGNVPEAEQLQSFAAATNFESSSLYLFAMPVEDCYEIRLQSVTIEWDKAESADIHPRAYFCRTYRPADVECAGGEGHTAGFAIRLPVAAERSSGSGSGMSNDCQRTPRGEQFDPSVAPENGGDGE